MRVGIIGLGYLGLPLAAVANVPPVVDFRGVACGIAAGDLDRL